MIEMADVTSQYDEAAIISWEAMQKVLDSASTVPLIFAGGSRMQRDSRRCWRPSHA
ncbi:hypothetical protein X738_18435 [Mesorhizobium sp. LNHC209A00]|nr:hypothetical protein X738_18435 [Mesorhizobium sp. LNHC209A00]